MARGPVAWALAVAVSSAPALAQDDPRGPAAVGPLRRTAGPPFLEPRFVIEADSLRVVEETGIGLFGSDEVLIAFSTDRTMVVSAEYGDLDAGEERALLSRNRCISPAIDPDGRVDGSWTCDASGGVAPSNVIVSIHEADAWLAGLWAPDGASQFPGIVVEGETDVAAPGRWDDPLAEFDLIGRHRLTLDAAALLTAMPREGDTLAQTVRVDGCSEAVTIRGETCGTGFGAAAYDVVLTYTRTADARVAPVVDRR